MKNPDNQPPTQPSNPLPAAVLAEIDRNPGNMKRHGQGACYGYRAKLLRAGAILVAAGHDVRVHPDVLPVDPERKNEPAAGDHQPLRNWEGEGDGPS